jgi:hypothetical protein
MRVPAGLRGPLKSGTGHMRPTEALAKPSLTLPTDLEPAKGEKSEANGAQNRQFQTVRSLVAWKTRRPANCVIQATQRLILKDDRNLRILRQI